MVSASKVRIVLAVSLSFLLLAGASADASEPRFTGENELLLPEGYREWIFVGASLGISYEEGNTKVEHPRFHNVYIQPQAYQAYRRSGRFPEKTMLVLETWTAGSRASILQRGQFEDRFAGVEAAVKDHSRFPEGWAYFGFTVPGAPPKAKAAAYPKERCWSCHNEHAESDNVFLQFYPVLREARKAKATGE